MSSENLIKILNIRNQNIKKMCFMVKKSGIWNI